MPDAISRRPPTPDPGTAPKPSLRIGSLFRWSASRRRWPVALRATFCVGVPVAIGWAAGDVSAGFLATIGAFTALYAADRPYCSRALVLAGVAVSLGFLVVVGVSTQQMPAMAIPVLAAIAMVTTFVCNSLRIGPPGAYMLALSCAAGTAIPTSGMTVWHIALLVLAGGALSWVVHMAGALIDPRGPEKAAVSAAAASVASFAGISHGRAQDASRHVAALALHDAWASLMTFQPARPHANAVLTDLRALNRELHLLFAACVNAADRPDETRIAVARRAAEIGAAAARARRATDRRTEPADIPIGYIGAVDAMRENLKFWSPASLAAARVGIAVALSGSIGSALGLEHAYWAMAAAVMILHQGLDLTRSLQRGIERIAGTLVGLGVAGAILAAHPGGLWLVAVVMILQFLCELLITRNYALTVIFITAIALTIASGGQAVPDLAAELWARGGDTILGCLVGLLVHVLTAFQSAAVPIRQEIVGTLETTQGTLACLARGDVTSVAARRMRRDLQRHIFRLGTAYELEIGGMPHRRAGAELLWPAVVASQRLGYKVLATCWSSEPAGPEVARVAVSPGEFASLSATLMVIIAAVRQSARPPAGSASAGFLAVEIDSLRDSIVASSG